MPYNQDHFLAIVTPEVWSIDEYRKEIGNIVQLFGGLGDNGRAHVSVVNNNLIGSEIGKQNRMFMWTVRTLINLPVVDNWIYLPPSVSITHPEWLERIKFQVRNTNCPYVGEVKDDTFQAVGVYPARYHLQRANENSASNSLWRYPSENTIFFKRCRFEHQPRSSTPLIRVVGTPTEETVLKSREVKSVDTTEAKDEKPVIKQTPEVVEDDESQLTEVTSIEEVTPSQGFPDFNTVLKVLNKKRQQLRTLARNFNIEDTEGFQKHLESIGFEVYSQMKWVKVSGK